jgi:hypothetical protein
LHLNAAYLAPADGTICFIFCDFVARNTPSPPFSACLIPQVTGGASKQALLQKQASKQASKQATSNKQARVFPPSIFY